jgi:prevent-host-death family protein
MRKLGLSEARRRLPELVRGIAKEGGHVDITYRGRPQARLMRVSDGAPLARAVVDDALRIELAVPQGDLLATVRALRGGHGQARTGWLLAGAESKPAKPDDTNSRANKRRKARPRR